MNAKELLLDIKEYCQQNADPKNVEKYSRYFKGGFNGYGLASDLIENKVKYYRTQSWMNIQLVYDVSRLLIPEEKYELPGFALHLLNSYSKELNKESFKQVENWFSLGINNWAHTDGIVQFLFPVFWKKEIIELKDLSKWRKSTNKFQRRCVPVAMIKLLKYETDFNKMFNFIDPLMMDTEREVHQGLGWFLRECWKRERDLTEEFLFKWKNNCARLIIQYATEKMTKEERLKFRKDKK